MKTRVVTIGPQEAASLAWSRMRERRIRHLVVTEHTRVIGVVSERDLGGRTGAAIRRQRLVRDLMSSRASAYFAAQAHGAHQEARQGRRGRRRGVIRGE